MKLTMLGTGNALVTKIYNTCFVLDDDKNYFLVDAGGGNEILRRLEKNHINLLDIHYMFITHKHIDHLLGMIWIIRIICQNMQKGKYEGDAYLYGHDEVIDLLDTMCHTLLTKKQTKYLNTRFHLIKVSNHEQLEIGDYHFTFFDIYSTKDKQYGFTLNYKDLKITCCGDEPYNEKNKDYVINSDYLLHEAFCLYRDKDIYNPYEKNHSTVKDACELAQSLNVKNLILYHTEDKNIENRKTLYYEEGKPYFNGNLYIPEDNEVIEL